MNYLKFYTHIFYNNPQPKTDTSIVSSALFYAYP